MATIRTLTPVQEITVGALQVGYEALDNYLTDMGTQHKTGRITEHTYDAAYSAISADMKVLSDKHESITGEPISLFHTV